MLRILLKAGILLIVAYIVQYLLQKVMFFHQHWYWLAFGAIICALIEDKLAIERRHTLIFLPIKSDMSAFNWLEDREYHLLLKKRNRRIYVDRAEKWFERNDFVRITLMENKLKLKINNQLAKEFTEDFIAVIQNND